jgi:hypothetical protein
VLPWACGSHQAQRFGAYHSRGSELRDTDNWSFFGSLTAS